MTQQLLPETPEKTQQYVKDRETNPSSAQSLQGGIHPVAQLQRTLGNQCVAKLIQARRLIPEGKIIGLQRKLTVGAADDQYEQEADRVARQVMNTPDAVVANSMQRAMSPEEDKNKILQTKPLASITPFLQREMVNNEEPEDKDQPIQAKFLTGTSRASLQRQPETEEDKKEPIQVKSMGSMSSSFEAGGDVETRVNQSKGRGSPLPDPVRAYMEPRFGVDFSDVRVHTGSDAVQMNRDVGAQAFTHGSDVYFGDGHSPNNIELTAHELTHVIQQTGSPQLQTKKREEEVAPSGMDSSIQLIDATCTIYDSGDKRAKSISNLSNVTVAQRAQVASFLTPSQDSFQRRHTYRNHSGAGEESTKYKSEKQSHSDRINPDLSAKKLGQLQVSPALAQQRSQSTLGLVQRASSDFQIRQIAPEDAANPNMLFFDLGKSSLATSERAKIAGLAVPPGRNLTLNGFSSEEGSDADNDAVIQARLNTVETALVAAGHTGTRTRVNLRTSGVGQINYRHLRSVEVLPTPIGLPAAPSTQSNCSAAGAINAPCGTAFTSAFPTALTAMLSSIIRLANPADASANALVSRLFSGVPRATVNTNMNALFSQVAALPAQHQCHSDCDAGCGRPAYQSGTGVGAGGALMTLCPDFLNATNVMNNAQTLVHESAHGTAGLSAEDIAYSNTRQITFLSPADAVRNTDSYVLLAFEIAFPGSMTIGPATPDTVVGMTAPEEDSARRALAWVESWLNYGDFDTEILYDTMNRSVPPAPAWDTSQSGDAFNIETMHLIAPVFGLTDPGTAAPFVQPTKTDKVKVAAIHDRYDQMYGAINWQVLNVSKGAIGSGAWQSQGASLPRLGQNVVLAPSFFAMGPADQVKDLVLLMATAMSGISSGFRQKYVDAMDLIRIHRGLGP